MDFLIIVKMLIVIPYQKMERGFTKYDAILDPELKLVPLDTF